MSLPGNPARRRGRPPKNKGEAGASQETAATSDALVGFESKLWLMADKLRNNMDAAEYKHVALGLIFLKYISDSFDVDRHTAWRMLNLVELAGMSRN